MQCCDPGKHDQHHLAIAIVNSGRSTSHNTVGPIRPKHSRKGFESKAKERFVARDNPRRGAFGPYRNDPQQTTSSNLIKLSIESCPTWPLCIARHVRCRPVRRISLHRTLSIGSDLHQHPEAMPHHCITLDQRPRKLWLILNGFQSASCMLKRSKRQGVVPRR